MKEARLAWRAAQRAAGELGAKVCEAERDARRRSECGPGGVSRLLNGASQSPITGSFIMTVLAVSPMMILLATVASPLGVSAVVEPRHAHFAERAGHESIAQLPSCGNASSESRVSAAADAETAAAPKDASRRHTKAIPAG